MNERRIRKSLLSITVGLLGLGLFAAYPTLERARELFPSGRLLGDGMNYSSDDYRLFGNDLHDDALPSERQQMMEYLLSSITSTPVVVSTNLNDGGVKVRTLRGLSLRVASLMDSFESFETNDVRCACVADYLGTVRPVDVPRDLVGQRSFVLNVTTNEFGGMVVSKMDDPRYDERLLQRRVYDANKGVQAYRKSLFRMCAYAVAGNRKRMSPSDFAAFTNRLVTVSGANEEERKEMFWALED